MDEEFNENEKRDLVRELEEALRNSTFGIGETDREMMFEGAVLMKDLYDGFIEAGFDEDKAMTLLVSLIIGLVE